MLVSRVYILNQQAFLGVCNAFGNILSCGLYNAIHVPLIKSKTLFGYGIDSNYWGRTRQAHDKLRFDIVVGGYQILGRGL